MNIKVQSKNLEPRLSSLETSVETLTLDMREVIRSIDSLRSIVSDHQRPQWGNLISAVGVSVVIIGAIGSSFITPLTVQLSHVERHRQDIAHSVEKLTDRMRELESRVSSNDQVITERVEAVTTVLNDIKVNGSGITRERLAVIEAMLKDAGAPKNVDVSHSKKSPSHMKD